MLFEKFKCTAHAQRAADFGVSDEPKCRLELGALGDDANQVVVVYDVSKPETFQSCKKWLAKIRQIRQGRPIPGVLVANKIDLEARRVGGGVSREDGQQFAASNGLCYFECSALTPNLGVSAGGVLSNVDMPFYFLADEFRKRYERSIEQAVQMRY